MRKTILASIIGATAFTALMSGQALAQDFYYRYPIANASNDDGSGGGDTDTGGDTGGTETCSEGMIEVDGNCVIDTEGNENVWRQFAVDNGVYRFNDDDIEFDRYIKAGSLDVGIDSLPTVPYPLDFIYDTIQLSGSSLTNVNGLSNIEYISNLYLTDSKITSFNLNNLSQVEGDFYLNDNEISNLDGLNSLNSVGLLNITGNNISNLSGLSNLITANRLYISDTKYDFNSDSYTTDGNNNLDSIFLPSLSGVVDEISFSNQTVKEVDIPNIEEIKNLSYNESDFESGVLEKLILPNLTQAIVRASNNNITDVDLSSIVEAAVIDLDDNEIVNLDLSSLKTVTASMYLRNNNLTNLDGISNLESVENLRIDDNPFTNLNGLSNIIEGNIYLSTYGIDFNQIPSLNGSPFCNSENATFVADNFIEDYDDTMKSDLCR